MIHGLPAVGARTRVTERRAVPFPEGSWLLARWSFFTESAKLEMGRRVLLVVFLGLLCAAGKCGGMDHVGISSS